MKQDMKKVLSRMSAIERLQWIAENAGGFNRLFKTTRPSYMQETLEAARDALPEGKHRRALDYICRHEGAVLCFGGKDAVRPAILEAVELMAKRKEEAAC